MHRDFPFTLIAGPCSIESESLLLEVAQEVRELGGTALRGGIHKMRTRPEAFQGLGQEALAIVKKAKIQTGLPIVSEITDPRQLEAFEDHVDVYQVGARNMHNTELLKELGRINKPILLKRGLSAYLDELLHAAEYIVRGGNSRILLCERGIRTYERALRNTLDLAAIPYLQERCDFPVLVDPSHATGVARYVTPMACAAIAAGADGILVEVHPRPSEALSDSEQALTFPEFRQLVERVGQLARTLGRELARPGTIPGAQAHARKELRS